MVYPACALPGSKITEADNQDQDAVPNRAVYRYLRVPGLGTQPKGHVICGAQTVAAASMDFWARDAPNN
jgi:hypothetical protein